MCKDKKPNASLVKHLASVGISAEVLKALMTETAESGWAIEELWGVSEIENLCRQITGGLMIRVANEIAVAVTEKRLGLKRFNQN